MQLSWNFDAFQVLMVDFFMADQLTSQVRF